MTMRREMPKTRKPRRGARVPDAGGIYDGTVGWEDGLDHFDLQDSGVPFVKVTLFDGHNPVTQGENTTPDRAKGRRVLARFNPKGEDIPDDGEHVIVAVPAKRAAVSGSAYIIGRAGPDPTWIPNRKPGEKTIYGPANQFIRMKKDGSVHIFTRDKPGDDVDGKSVSFQVRPDGFVLSHPHMRVTYGPNGGHLVHSSGARIDFSACGGLPFPLNQLASIMKLSAAMVKIEASAVEIGPDLPAVADNLIKSTPMLALLTAMQAEIAAILAYLAEVSIATGVVAVPAVSAAAGAATTAVGVVTGLMIAAPGTLPTQSVTGY